MKKTMKQHRPIRVGVIGVGRGHGFAAGAGPHLGMELVALCDTWEERLLKVGKELGVATYTDYDTFLEHDMDAVVKLLQVGLRGHGNWVRIHGSRGHMENLRHGDRNCVWFRRENYHEGDGQPEETTERAAFPPEHQAAANSGHGGGDYFMNYHFAEAIRTGAPPYWDVYRGVAASIVGILAYRSALQDSAPLEVPDFRDADVRQRYADDHWSPDPTTRKPGDPWPSIRGDIHPSPEALAYARTCWQQHGYTELR